MTTFGELACEVCGIKGSETPMFRANLKGVPGRWRCEGCMEGDSLDPIVLAITDRIEVDNMRRRAGG